MGVVFAAVDVRLNRKVALKILPAEAAQDPERRDRFRREALAVAQLSHPNICPVFDVGEQDQTHFVAFELIDGQTLRERMRQGPIDWTEAVRIGMQCASALECAHGQGITHRDIKPGNVMLTKSGEVKLVDFGLAKFESPRSDGAGETELLTSPGVVMGTVDYMSPEQACGAEVDGRSDIFSLGVILYELFGARRPFGGRTDVEVLSNILHVEPTAIVEPRGAGAVVAKCLAKKPEDRYPTAGDLLRDLQRLQSPSSNGIPAELTQTIVTSRPHIPRRMSRRFLLGGGAAVAALASGALLYRRFGRRDGKPTLAVIPFSNATGEADLDYLAESLAEEFTIGISQVKEMRVLAQGAIGRLKQGERDVASIGRKLGATVVVTGRIVRAGQALAITVFAEDGRDGHQIWARKFTTGIDGMQSVSGEMTRDLLEALQIAPAADEQQRIARRTAGGKEAFELYLKGRYQWNKRTRESFDKAADFYRQALDKDSGFALAWAGLADVYMMQSGYITPNDVSPKAEAAALNAIRLDPNLAEGYASLAFTKLHYRWDWAEAEKNYRQAIRLNPNYATGHSSYARFLNVMRRFPEAVESVRRAQELDPLAPGIAAGFGLCYYFQRDFEKAAAEYKRLLEFEPNYAVGHANLGAAYVQLKRLPDAVREYAIALKSMSGDASTLCEIAYARGLSGDKKGAAELLNRVLPMRSTRYVSAPAIAWAYLGLGDRQTALEWLERGYEERSWPMIFLGIEPRYDALREEPRFKELVRKMHL
jgi:tetratricopeptide (TPR) repeat protein